MVEERKPEKRRQYTREFKLEAVRLVTSGEKGLNQVARQLGIRPDMLRQWKRQAQGEPTRPAADVFPGHGQRTSQDEEIRRLKREVAQLREEREILKKAAAFFARESR
jgi:transposase-like protein